MKSFKVASMILTLGTALMSGGSLFAGERYDIRRDDAVIRNLRADIERDRCRLNEDLRAGRRREAERDRADLARDQRALDMRQRDVHHDRNEFREGFRGR